MKVINIHKREIRQPKSELTKLFNTLATDNDMILATDKWSPMKLDNGLHVGSRGGHGPIKYFVTEYQSGKSVTFQFELPGFNGFHRFEINELEPNKTEISHIIEMTTAGSATLKWALAIRWLHDAYIEDAFDKVENHFTKDKKNSEWSWWVKLLRKIMKPKKK
ncbi:hypothetical protein HZQ44_06875 [Elizabethkingia anophelis]|uniref:hypothetical protein n=1 Tax=Elizabethkingia anophelis TaxID=1117645 RepID=UPI001627FED4|nr:hypothetical protein [Elizabethkingia anophelis]MCT3647706.1 hypothetical protein [Elizabethkingia anophelis]MCT3694958.1 hypothetical protein [Elizabethkingia anophelis]MCT3858876.1 hypothetical protein [Elizabethkingia anophelis]MCT3912001.1 hypothetical protein [Elizabethkingia anophelis]MCT4311252.1 hypothetical protein [Elizabethkingia anophelis]